VVVLPEVTSPDVTGTGNHVTGVIVCACSTGSYYSSNTVVPLRMTDRAIGSDVTRRRAHAQLKVVVSRSFFVFSDILCSTQYPFSSFF